MTFLARFACLWCGSDWQTRGPDDLEGWARLCPTCLGRAQENPFLARRLRAGIVARGAGRAVAPAAAGDASGPDALEAAAAAWLGATVAEQEDWILRRGRYARGPVRDLAWSAELDGLTGFLDALPPAATVLEPAAGPGFWSPLLAGKGELSVLEATEDALDRARDRLVAHGLRAHLHLRAPWAVPETPSALVVLAFRLCHVPDARLAARCAALRAMVAPGGRLAIVERAGDPETDAPDDPPAVDGVARRRLPDGRELAIPLVARPAADLADALRAAGFVDVTARSTGRFFHLLTAV
ncbi:MAG: class I SAM-dependent methyltransferase [Chloroflexota bacterium]